MAFAGDDHGDTVLAATRIAHYGVSEPGQLEAPGDVDVFRLDLQGRATIEVRGSGRLDTRASLLDHAGDALATDDDSGSGLNFRFVETLDGGVYYVAVTSATDTGSYKVTARIVRDGDDHGDTAGASTFLPHGLRTTGRIIPATDVDVFRIDVPAATGLRVHSGGPADTVGELRDSENLLLARRDKGGHGDNFRIGMHVEPGIYYVRVTAKAAGAYTLGAETYESARNVFDASVADPIIQGRCIACHVADGEARGTGLVFASSATAGHADTNFNRFQTFVAGQDGRTDLILAKVRGLAEHGGGAQLEAGSPDFLALERFLTLLSEEAGNARPTIAGIPDLTVRIGTAKTVAVAVSGADAYTLQATSDDQCVATVETTGATLTVNGLVAGTALVSVTATDDSGSDAGPSQPQTFTVTVQPPPTPAWALPRAAPASAGVTACAAADVLDHAFGDRAVQAVLLAADGAVIAERYADGYDVASLGTSWSVAKSFYSAAIGVAIDRGNIDSLDQPASDFFTEWAGTDKATVTVRQLLEMRAGLPDPNIFVEYDQTAFALGQDLVAEPGTTFRYSNANSQLFEPLLRRATGMDAHDWLEETILGPIGIDRNALGLWLDPTGAQPLTYCCLDMRPDDFARFGILFANEGVWDGNRIVSRDYARTSLAAQSAVYGLQWWVMNAAYFYGDPPPIDVSAAHGYQGQHVYVWRDGGVVLVVLTKYVHDPNQGYVLSLANFPSTCAGRNACPDSDGPPEDTYDERVLLDLMAALR